MPPVTQTKINLVNEIIESKEGLYALLVGVCIGALFFKIIYIIDCMK